MEMGYFHQVIIDIIQISCILRESLLLFDRFYVREGKQRVVEL